jgi:hypothetical protein
MAYYYKHPDLVLPDNNYVIWRYMDLSKFLSMLNYDAIFFSRADKQTDKLEGEYPNGMLSEIERRWGEGIKSDDGVTYTFLEWHVKKEIASRLISCWSTNPVETRRRWIEYTINTESVAIRSTIGKLTSCFDEEEEPVVWIGKVRYGEEENKLPGSSFRWNANYFLYPFFAKDETYRWENEIRAIVNISQKKQAKLGHSSNGCYIKANLQKLIESVWVHPKSSISLWNQVKAALESYNLKKVDVYHSPWDSLS